MKCLPVLLLLVFTSALHAIDRSELPNIILCMTDDQGWGDVGYNGHPELKTPHLDQMSREGVTFTRFYAAAAMCSPTRGSCYTGRNPYRFGITFAMKGMLERKEVLITSVLRNRGYRTGHFGKWHMGTLSKIKGDQSRWGAFSTNPERYYCPPWERDVKVSFVTESKVPTWDPMLHPGQIKTGKRAKQEAALAGKPYGNEYFTGPDQKATENLDGDDSRVIMDRVIPFIEKAAKRKQPFFAAVWFHTPHSPVVGGPKYLNMYKDLDENKQHYYGCLTAMDEQVGRMRAKLKELNIDNNTMLWFCSDNGPARQGSPRHVGTAKHLSGYKLSIKEGGIRVPGLLVWPKLVTSPMTIDAPCFTSDYFPTILDSLNAPLPKDRTYDGISLLPLLKGERKQRGKPLGFLNKNGKEAVWMEDKYKLFLDAKGPKLYDIPNDPSEKNNLADQLPDVTARMTKELSVWKDEVMSELAEVN